MDHEGETASSVSDVGKLDRDTQKDQSGLPSHTRHKNKLKNKDFSARLKP